MLLDDSRGHARDLLDERFAADDQAESALRLRGLCLLKVDELL